VKGKEVMLEVQVALSRMKEFCWSIRSYHWRVFSNKPFIDVVSIGGFYLVSKLALESLKAYWSKQIKCSYLASIDASNLTEIKPRNHAFIVQSRSFNTLETLRKCQCLLRAVFTWRGA